jgi:ribosomal protein S20
MVDTTVQINNKAIAYRGGAQRERPRTMMSGIAIAPQSQSDGGPYENQEDQGNTQMPWTAKTFKARHNRSATSSQASTAAAQATALVNSGVDEGKSIAIANKTVQRMRRKGVISNGAADRASARGNRFAGHDQEPIDAASR